MGDVFRLQGTYGVESTEDSVQSLDPSIATAISETVALSKKMVVDYELTADAIQAVAFGGLASANVVVIKVEDNRKVLVRVTSADGATQSIPVDTVLVLISMSVSITALDLTRVAGIGTTVRVFLGQRA